MKYMILIAALMLAGCNTQEADNSRAATPNARIYYETLDDGTRCAVVYNTYDRKPAGITCNWRTAK